MIKCLDTLRNKRREYSRFLVGSDLAVNAGGKNDPYIVGKGSVCYQTPYQQVDHLAAGCLPAIWRGVDALHKD